MVRTRRAKNLTLTQAIAQSYRLYVNKSCVMKVGIDYAYKSPSWSIYDGHEYFSYFIAQRKREEGLNFVLQSASHPTLAVHISSVMNMMPKDVLPVERNHRLADVVLSTINHHRETRKLSRDDVHVAIERYAFGCVGFSSISDLHESGGVLKNYLFRDTYRNVIELSPGTVKRIFTTKGNANKVVMLQQYMTRFGLPDPSLSLKFHEAIDFTDEDLKKVAKPIEDLVDGLAILASIEPRLGCIGTNVTPELLAKLYDAEAAVAVVEEKVVAAESETPMMSDDDGDGDGDDEKSSTNAAASSSSKRRRK